MHHPGRAHVEIVGPRDIMETVRVGGTAFTTIRGEFTLCQPTSNGR